MIVKIEEADLRNALAFLRNVYPRVRFTSKSGRQYLEFPPGMSKEGSAALNLLATADQTIHQEYLPQDLLCGVSVIRNLFNPKS